MMHKQNDTITKESIKKNQTTSGAEEYKWENSQICGN